jgi:hypothetical protein
MRQARTARDESAAWKSGLLHPFPATNNLVCFRRFGHSAFAEAHGLSVDPKVDGMWRCVNIIMQTDLAPKIEGANSSPEGSQPLNTAIRHTTWYTAKRGICIPRYA